MEAAGNGSASQKAAKIWILLYGSRGDHESAAALALGLKAKGHRVKVFGCVEMRKLFAAHGLDFDALDMDPIANPADPGSARQAQLRKLASDAGFEGPSKVEDWLLDTRLLWQEYANRIFTQLLEDGRSIPEAVALVAEMPAMVEMRRLEVSLQGFEGLNETRHQFSAFLALFHQQALQDYIPVARAARDAFRAFLREAAKQAGCRPYELLRATGAGLLIYLGGLAVAAGQAGDVKKLYIESVKDFASWYDILAKDHNGTVDEYWKRWMSRFPPLEACYPHDPKDGNARAMLNMQLWFDSAPLEERPDLIIAHPVAFSSALELQARGELKLLYWAPITVHWQGLRGPAIDFTTLCFLEADPAKPVSRSGPLRFLRMLLRGRFLASTSASTMEEASASIQSLKECCTGPWVLDAPKSVISSTATQQERDELDAFLAAEGGAPVYFGWGSSPMPVGGPDGLARLVVKTLRKLGRRGVVNAGLSMLRRSTLLDAIKQEYDGDWAHAQRAQRRILLLTRASRTHLFPQCVCTVHHGSSGTTHAALRSGVPTVVSPLDRDQPANADWVVSLGCGVKVASLIEVTPHELAEAITTVLGDDSYQTKAKDVAAAMAEERGVASAVDKVETVLEAPQPLYSEQAPKSQTWADGLYEFHRGTTLDCRKLALVIGEAVYTPQKGPLGQIWAGDFHVEANGDGIAPGTYTVQAITGDPMTCMMYGTVGADGRELFWHDGSRHTWKAPALLQDGIYYTWREGTRQPLQPTTVRDGKFFTGGEEIGGMEAGDFELKHDTDDGRKAGKHHFKASWPKYGIVRYGGLVEDGRTLILDDGYSLQWDSPLP